MRATDLPAASPPTARRARRASPDLLALGGVAVVLLAFFASLFPARGFHFPVGPDSPVYLWWSRLAGHAGLSAVADRPGVPALSLVAGGTLGRPQAETIAGLEVALAAGTGLAAAALVAATSRAGGWERRVAWALAGLLSGGFAGLLAGGYVSNLAFVAVFLAAAVLLSSRSRPGAIGAVALLGAGGLAHPLFFVLGAAILAVAAVPTLRRRADGQRLRDTEGGRIVAVLAGGTAVAGVGLLAMLPGFGPLRVDTSQDAFLRQAGLGGTLRHDYGDRLARHWTRYLLPVSAPLAAVGGLLAGGFLGRFLRAWAAVVVLGAAVGLLTGLAPAERFLDFAFFLPIGAAVAVPMLWRTRARTRAHGRRWVGAAVATAILLAVGGLLVVEGRNWWQQRPFLSTVAAQEMTEAARAANATPPGSPLVFVVDSDEPTISFLATRLGNLARDAVPAARIPDVYVYVGSPARFLAGRPTLNGQVEHDTLSRLYLQDIRRAGGRPVAFWLERVNAAGGAAARAAGTEVAPGVIQLGAGSPSGVAGPPRPDDPLVVPPPWRLSLAGVAVFALLTVVGLGWAQAATAGLRREARLLASLALAPAVGGAALILSGAFLERIGVPLSGAGPPAISGAVALGGYALAYGTGRRRGVAERKALPEAEPEVPE